MLRLFKNNKSSTLVEVLVAMLILSSSAAGVISAFSYAFSFIKRAGQKLEGLNYSRKVLEAYRAIYLADPADSRLAEQADTDVKVVTSIRDLAADYDRNIYVTINWWDPPQNTIKQIGIKANWSD